MPRKAALRVKKTKSRLFWFLTLLETGRLRKERPWVGVGATAKVTGWLPRGLPCGKYPQHCDHKRETERGRERQELEGGADRLRALGFGRAPALHRWFPPGSWDHPGLRLHSHLPWRNSGVCVFLSKLKDPEEPSRCGLASRICSGDFTQVCSHLSSARPPPSRHRSRSGSASQRPAQGNVGIRPGPAAAPGLGHHHPKQRAGQTDGKSPPTQEAPERTHSRVGSES